MQDIRLCVHIENTEPLELMSLTSSLASLHNQYEAYVKKHLTQNISSNAKLYVREIRQGSTILELAEYAAFAVLPFIENTNTIVGFARYCKHALTYLKGKSADKPEMGVADYREFSNLVNPIIADRGGKIDIGTVINGNVTYVFQVDHTEANAIQNTSKREIEALRETKPTDFYEKVLMTWSQTNSDIKNDTKNRGVIDRIFPGKPLKILFEDEDTKRKMLYGDENPLTSVYEVDVRVETSQGKPIAYRITHLHSMFEA